MSPSPDMRVNAEQAHAKGKLPMDHGVWWTCSQTTVPVKRNIVAWSKWMNDFTGWCCSHCPWGLTAPRLESTVAALAFNRWLKTLLRNTIAPTAPTESPNARGSFGLA